MAAIFAQYTGSRYGATRTLMPSRSFSVHPARNASTVNGSRNGASGGTKNDPDQL